MDLLRKLSVLIIFLGLSTSLALPNEDQQAQTSGNEAAAPDQLEAATNTQEETQGETDSQPRAHSLNPTQQAAQPPAKPLKPLQLQEEIKAHANTDLPQDI